MSRIIPDTNANANVGIVWSTEDVAKGTGPSKVIVCDFAQIPSIVDLDLFRREFGDAPLLGWANGQSLRVNAQAICRRMAKSTPEEQRAAILNYIRGVRNVSTVKTVEKKVFFVPTPEDITDVVPVSVNSEAELVAAFVDREWDTDQAIRVAGKLWAAQK